MPRYSPMKNKANLNPEYSRKYPATISDSASGKSKGDRLASAGARRLALFHHDPTRDDRGVADMEELARERFPETFAARQGMELML